MEFLARQVLPGVRRSGPTRSLGHRPRPRPGCSSSKRSDGVHVTGGVEDMRSWLTGSRVWAGPFLDGTGIKTKLLEAMAAISRASSRRSGTVGWTT